MRDALYRITVKNVGEVEADGLVLRDHDIEEIEAKTKQERVHSATASEAKDDKPNPPRENKSSIIRHRVTDKRGHREGWRPVATSQARARRIANGQYRPRKQGSGELTYRFSVSAKGEHLGTGKILTRFVNAAPMEIDFLRTGSNTIKVGDEVVYTLRLRNGEQRTNSNVVVELTIPDGLELIAPKPVGNFGADSERSECPRWRKSMLRRVLGRFDSVRKKRNW